MSGLDVSSRGHGAARYLLERRCAALQASCSSCWAAGCRFCEVGPYPWTSGRDARAQQGDKLDSACMVNHATACEQLTVMRSHTAYARTVPRSQCPTPSPTPPPAPNAGAEELNTTADGPKLAGADTGASLGADDPGGDRPVLLIAIAILGALVLAGGVVVLWMWWRRRRASACRIHVAAPSMAASARSKVPQTKGANAAAVTRDNTGGGPPSLGTSAVPASVARDKAGAHVWDFQRCGRLVADDIHRIVEVIAAAEQRELRAQQASKRGTESVKTRRCLAFGADNNLGPDALAALGTILDRFPAVALTFENDWRLARDKDLHAFARLLGRHRGACLVRPDETAPPGTPGPLRLPLQAAPTALAAVAEAVSVADHGEVDALSLEPLSVASATAVNESGVVSLDVARLRLTATELTQTSTKLGDKGAVLACAFVGPWGSRLQIIRLADCDVGDVGAEAVASLLRGPASSGSVRELVLSANHIGDRGAQALASVLDTTCDGLERLVLDRNRIGRKGAEAIAKRLPRSEIRELVLGSHLGGNPSIGDAGAAAIATALDDRLSRAAANRSGRLQFLSLEDCGVGDPAAAILSGWLPHSALNTLSVARGNITDEGAAAVIRALPKCTVALDLAGNALGDATGMVVGDALAAHQELAVSLAQNRLSPTMQRLLQAEHGSRLRV
eukprot:TRINITY_DN3656_c1_g3_i2.p1 TRINITY_DN3656_c1_g3~~TRINITY_DN3656_c1_g3_i2.p1  ORF type:complete len:721 (+),score=90.34 TRINITY_DN3656_c1_g3_i2:133-2163(+)